MLHIFPSTITAGLSLRCEFVINEYLAPSWSLVAFLRGPSTIDISSSASGTGHVLALTGPQTSAILAGEYSVAVRAVSGDDVFAIESGRVSVVADLALAAAGHDGRGHAERTLAAIEAVLESRASRDQESYTINGRSLVRTPIADLLTLRDRYKKEAATEKRGGKPRRLLGRQVRVGFGS